MRDTNGDAERCHKLYMEALKKWHCSSFSHEKVDAVWTYLEKGTLMQVCSGKDFAAKGEGYLDDAVKARGGGAGQRICPLHCQRKGWDAGRTDQ